MIHLLLLFKFLISQLQSLKQENSFSFLPKQLNSMFSLDWCKFLPGQVCSIFNTDAAAEPLSDEVRAEPSSSSVSTLALLDFDLVIFFLNFIKFTFGHD
jgi:hypothetical protein